MQSISKPTPPADRALGLEGVAQRITDQIATTPASLIEVSLQRAIEDHIIDKHFEQLINAWLARYRHLAEQAAMKEGGPTNAKALLEVANLPKEKHQTFLNALLQGGSADEVMDRIREDQHFTAAEIESLEVTLALNDLMLGDAALMTEMMNEIRQELQQARQMKGGTWEFRQAELIRIFKRMQPEHWEETLNDYGINPPDFIAGETADEKRSNYGILLSKRAAMSYPTAAFAGALEMAIIGEGEYTPALQNPELVLRFLDAHPDFELGSTSVDGYLKEKANASFFNSSNKPKLARDLKAVQRVFKLAPNFAASNTLLKDGLHSARQIYALGKSAFVRQYASRDGFTEQLARDAYQRAAHTQATVATIVGYLRTTQNANAIQALANPVQALNDFPNLANLFGQEDICECEQCRSMFSPAAYLADVLMYLKARKAIAGNSVKDVLFERRPDIGYLELTCENSETPLPYVDVVCEILEDRVAPCYTLPLALEANFVEGPLDAIVAAPLNTHRMCVL